MRRPFVRSKDISGSRRSVVLLIAEVLFVLSAHLLWPATASARANQEITGAAVFAAAGCTHCHGTERQGTDSGPDLRCLRKHLSAQQTKHQIEAGGQAMPAFGSSLTQEQIQQLVAFLRAKASGW